ncbi:PREDICTED: tripartite motif-containing protein 5-like isoform X2 [Miniopterus natalensis]|uniref:tripartite motif-containing protein 5-like isoform X2 n=1 Tax=Miniopterus natalensis TaxID=291302 RepID=UPI0007A6DA20|nr:PREDICTED: tripartite motif-containing protein 5-like isoform X2 [Miniopterus natalensis]
MASEILVEIKEEVTCPICLELLTEPLSLDCGHSFCQACITTNSRQSMIRQEGESSCPVCRITYQPEKLRPNRHVASIVEALRKVKLNTEEELKRDLCERHGEKLLLFCKEDEKIICWLCERSQEHRGHPTFLMEEVAQEYKNKIQNGNKFVQYYYKQLRGILDSEEQKELQRLEKEEGDNLDDLAQAESELVQQGQLLTDLISDLEHRLQGSTVEMLQDVKSIIKRSQTFILRKPEALSKKQRTVIRVPDLKMLQAFMELTDARQYWVHFTLSLLKNDPDVAISLDQRQVKVLRWSTTDTLPENDYQDCDVLGSRFITSGKHYWEIDVSEKRAWILGVYCAKRISFQQGYSKYQPQLGYWVIGLQNQFEYKAFVDSATYNSWPYNIPSPRTLTLTVPPRRVGVFLDYNAGTLSFLNVTNNGFLIYKFSACSFSGECFPYFNPMKCTGPMTLCSSSS